MAQEKVEADSAAVKPNTVERILRDGKYKETDIVWLPAYQFVSGSARGKEGKRLCTCLKFLEGGESLLPEGQLLLALLQLDLQQTTPQTSTFLRGETYWKQGQDVFQIKKNIN